MGENINKDTLMGPKKHYSGWEYGPQTWNFFWIAKPFSSDSVWPAEHTCSEFRSLKNNFLLSNFLQDLQHEMTTWKILNLCRSIAVIFGWMIVSLRPNTDLLYKNLEKLSNYNTPPSAVYKTAWKMKIK